MDSSVASTSNDVDLNDESASLLGSLIGLNSSTSFNSIDFSKFNQGDNSSISLFGSLIKSLNSSTSFNSNQYNDSTNSIDHSVDNQSTKSILKTPRKIRSYTIGQKLEVIKFSNDQSINAAHRKFGIDRKCIRTWRKNEDSLLSLQESTMMTPLKKRRPGAGRKVKDTSFDADLAKWLNTELAETRNPSRATIQWKALEMAYNSGDVKQEFKASTGWLEKFLTRRNFRPKQFTRGEVLRMHGNSVLTVLKEICEFAAYFQELKQQNKYEHVYLAYTTSILVDSLDLICIDDQIEGEQSTTKATNQSTTPNTNKIRISMILTIRSDGKKLLPFVVLPHESLDVSTVSQQLHIIQSDRSEIDNELLPQYIKNVFDKDPICKRLILWNAFGCQLSEELSRFLERNQITNMLIPAKFVDLKQALNIRLDSVFKKELFNQYNNWNSSGNVESLQINLILNWVVQGWSSISERSIAELFITQEVKDTMSQLMKIEDQCISNNEIEISTVDETCQEDYKKFLDKIIETIGLEIASLNNQL